MSKNERGVGGRGKEKKGEGIWRIREDQRDKVGRFLTVPSLGNYLWGPPFVTLFGNSTSPRQTYSVEKPSLYCAVLRHRWSLGEIRFGVLSNPTELKDYWENSTKIAFPSQTHNSRNYPIRNSDRYTPPLPSHLISSFTHAMYFCRLLLLILPLSHPVMAHDFKWCQS